MNKMKVIYVAVLLLLSGCTSSLFKDSHMEDPVPEEKLKQVEPFDLYAMSIEEDAGSKPTVITHEPPPATLELTLEEVRALTIENNLTLKVELINPEISSANTKSIEAKKYEIIFQTGLTYEQTDNPLRDLDITGTQGENTYMNLGLSAPLETGGRVDVNLNDAEQKTNRSGTDFPSAYTVPLSFSITQPLLKNAGRREFMHSIRIAKYDQQSASAAAKLQLINIIAAADQAYWDLYKSTMILEVRRKQLELTEAQLESARRFVAAGERPQIEVLRAEAGLAGQRSSIIAAENAFRHSQRQLKYILNKPGLDMNGPTKLVPGTEADPVFLKLDPGKLVKHAAENRMELLQYRLNIARNASTIAHLRNVRMPDLNFQYLYTINSLGENRGDAYEMLGEMDYENHRVALSLNFPIGRKSSKSDLLAALHTQRQLELSRQTQEDFIAQEVHGALDTLESSWQQILASRKSAQLDGQLYEAEKRQFEVATRTSTEVLQAQARYADSVSAEYIALANYQISLMELARSTGTLLGAAKVE